MYGLLTPDVPLGPFEGASITVYSTQGKQAKLHATSTCSYLRSARVTPREMPLDASVIGRMCPQCGAYGSWARPGTGLAIFLDMVTGLGLLYELGCFRDADEDACSDDEVQQAASALHRPPWACAGEDVAQEDEDDAWEELQEARRVRETVFDEWRRAQASMHRVQQQLERFPWLRPWAGAAVELKAGRLRTLQAQAGRLVVRDALLAAAAAAAVAEPDLPAEEPAFAPLGAPAEVKKQLMSLWRQWRSAVEDSWDNPRKQDYLVYRLADMMGRRRKGRDHMLDRARALLAEWEVAARPAAGERHRERVLVASFPRDKVTEHASRGSFLDQLSEWELGVLAAYTIDTVWQPQPVITVQVPEPVAARLLTREDGLCFAEAETAVGGAGAAETTAERSPEAALPLGPGVFDDTPVSSRRLVTGEHLRALRATMRDAEQLYIVFSVDAGLEVVALSLLEERCASGCHHRWCQRSACRSFRNLAVRPRPGGARG